MFGIRCSGGNKYNPVIYCMHLSDNEFAFGLIKFVGRNFQVELGRNERYERIVEGDYSQGQGLYEHGQLEGSGVSQASVTDKEHTNIIMGTMARTEPGRA